MNHDASHRYEWNTIPWHKLEVRVFKLQKRIYQATTRGKTKKAHRLQKLLASSWSAKSLAVRRVTQENTGKKTAGVDGVKNLTPPQRLKLISDIDLHTPVKPVRRVWIDCNFWNYLPRFQNYLSPTNGQSTPITRVSRAASTISRVTCDTALIATRRAICVSKRCKRRKLPPVIRMMAASVVSSARPSSGNVTSDGSHRVSKR